MSERIVTPVDWTKVVVKNALRHSLTDLVTVIKRVPPVQSGPDAGIAGFVPQRHQVVIGSLGLNQLRYGDLTRR